MEPNRGHAWDIFRDETLRITGGWEYAHVVRDRILSIYRDVNITKSGPVTIKNPDIITDYLLPATSIADIRISAELSISLSEQITGILSGSIGLIIGQEFPAGKSLDALMNQVISTKEVSPRT